MQITITGTASQKKYVFIVTQQDLELTLLNFLLNHNLPMAYSCHGKQVCEKCIVNDSILSCSLTVADTLKEYRGEVFVSYL